MISKGAGGGSEAQFRRTRRTKSRTNVSGVAESKLHDWPNFFIFWGDHARAPLQPLSVKTYMARHDTTPERHGTTRTRQDTTRSGALRLAGQIDNFFLIWPTKGKAKHLLSNQPPQLQAQLWAGLVWLGAWLGLAWPGRSSRVHQSFRYLCLKICISLGAMWREMRCRVISFPASGLSVSVMMHDD